MPSVASTETKPRQSTTRVTSYAPLAVKHRPSDYALVERFRFDHGRWPECGDGPAYWALLRMQTANLIAQATTAQLPGETDQSFAWRTRSALRAVVRTSHSSREAYRIVRTAARASRSMRARESGARRRHDVAASRAGDSGDRPHLPADDVERPRASRRGSVR